MHNKYQNVNPMNEVVTKSKFEHANATVTMFWVRGLWSFLTICQDYGCAEKDLRPWRHEDSTKMYFFSMNISK